MRDRQQDPPVMFCSKCGGEIYEGETYYHFGDENICGHCMDEAERTAGEEFD